MNEDRTSLAWWFPRVEAAGLPVPRTRVCYPGPMDALLDGEEPEGYAPLVDWIRTAGSLIGWPVFLRTGHGSGKHQWSETCHLPGPDEVPAHVGALVEWSHVADFIGLPTDVWAVRELIATEALCICTGYRGFPVVREFRLFVDGGGVTHVQPYWPPDAVEEGRPDRGDWRERLRAASRLAGAERGHLHDLALAAARAVGGGHWSVDLLQAANGGWWLTDMAEGERSYRWGPS